MNHDNLRKLQKAQKNILFDFDKFCRAHDLTYYMAFGTLLGAVRHKGFIPWDDDIDIFMTRSEYNKFRKAQHELPTKYKVWEVCYSDIHHAGLIRIITQDKELGGVLIDIFILDYQKENFGDKGIRNSLSRLLHFAKLSKNEKNILLHHFADQPKKKFVVHFSKVVRLLVGGSANAEKLIYNLRVSKTPTSRYCTLEDKISFPVYFFEDCEELEFDGHLLYAPSSYEDLLATMYGDFRQIPPSGHKWLKEEGLE